MICFYHQNKNGICIDRCLGSDGILELPEEIDGQPVTELASYIFSEGLDEDDRQSYLKMTESTAKREQQIRTNIRT